MSAPGAGRGGPRPQGVPSAVRGAALIGLAVVVGIIGLQILDDSSPGGSGSATPAVVTDGTAAPTTGSGAGTIATTAGSTATTSTKVKPPGQVKVKVYNASGVQGRAGAMTDKLKAAGYNTLTPENLSKSRTGTVVQCRSGFAKEGVALVLFQVQQNSTAEAFPSSPPAGSSDADCLVIIGTSS